MALEVRPVSPSVALGAVPVPVDSATGCSFSPAHESGACRASRRRDQHGQNGRTSTTSGSISLPNRLLSIRWIELKFARLALIKAYAIGNQIRDDSSPSTRAAERCPLHRRVISSTSVVLT